MSKMFAKDITNKNMTACLSILMMCIFVLSACNVNNKKGVKIKGSDSVFVFRHESANAIYHWKSTLAPYKYEMTFMQKHHIKRMYVKFFDVSTDKMYILLFCGVMSKHHFSCLYRKILISADN